MTLVTTPIAAEAQDPPAAAPTMRCEAELVGKGFAARIVRFDIPAPTSAVMCDPDSFQINMCLTPRPLDARACYHRRWGGHRFERLGDIFLLPPGEELLVKGGSIRQASLTCELATETISRIVGRDLSWSDTQIASTIDIGSGQIRALLFRLAQEVRHPGFATERMLEFLVGQLAIEIARYCLEVSERPQSGGLAGWRLRLIDERLSESPVAPSLSELARLCNISVRQLTRGFKVSRHCSIGDYVEQRRMETAKRMLVHGENVKSVAFTLGYASPSSFTFAFRRALGISPSQFRQRQTRAIRAD